MLRNDDIGKDTIGDLNGNFKSSMLLNYFRDLRSVCDICFICSWIPEIEFIFIVGIVLRDDESILSVSNTPDELSSNLGIDHFSHDLKFTGQRIIYKTGRKTTVDLRLNALAIIDFLYL